MNILGQEKSSKHSLGGITTDNLEKLYKSKNHNEYSINGVPDLTNLPSPSRLDLDGKTPAKYMDNLPL